MNDFCKQAHNGDFVDVIGFTQFVNGFDNVILWGAGNLGTAIGAKLIALGVKISCYWDIRANDINDVNNIRVVEPFAGDFAKEKSLIVFCINNVPVSPNLYRKLVEQKWPHIIKGNDLLQGLICSLSNFNNVSTKICNDSEICTVCSCERLSNVVKNRVLRKNRIADKELLSFDRVHFIVNNFCNLKCKHCFLYMNSYPNEKKKNVKAERIFKDISMVLKAVHSFGVVNVFGGETFLCPYIGDIVKKILEHTNFGSVVVSTNGVCKISNKQLEGLKENRVRLAFSNYLGSLDHDKEQLFNSNFILAKSTGVTTTMQNALPNWLRQSSLGDKYKSIDDMKKKKSTCGVLFLYVFDGKIFPCSYAFSIHDLGVADYHGDYVEIDDAETPLILRNKIRDLVNATYYKSCSHCDPPANCLTNRAGEQGLDKRYLLPNKA